MSKKEYLIERGLFSITLLMVLIICLLVIFVIIEAIPAFDYCGVLNFIFNMNWAPDSNQFGIFPMIVGSIGITAIALLISVPLSIFCAIFLEEIASVRLKNYFKPIIQTLAGIPSVIYGFFGLTLIAPIIRNIFGGSGFSILTASIVLALMITPTIILLSQDAIKSVPNYYREASFGLGSTQWQCIKSIIFPVALPGILTAVILGIASPIRTLTSNIALEMGYATEIHYSALFATAIILFVVIMCLMVISVYVQNKYALKEVI